MTLMLLKMSTTLYDPFVVIICCPWESLKNADVGVTAICLTPLAKMEYVYDCPFQYAKKSHSSPVGYSPKYWYIPAMAGTSWTVRIGLIKILNSLPHAFTWLPAPTAETWSRE